MRHVRYLGKVDLYYSERETICEDPQPEPKDFLVVEYLPYETPMCESCKLLMQQWMDTLFNIKPAVEPPVGKERK